MLKASWLAAALLAASVTCAQAQSAQYCQRFGPQAPRDITSKGGSNPRAFPLAPAASELNLCNLHFHVNAEHKGPGFSLSAGGGEHGGFKCNETAKLTAAELKPVDEHAGCHGIKPGDTIEVHWVFTSCDVTPGSGLGACLSEQCTNPTLRVESQVFLVVNSKTALDFTTLDYGGLSKAGFHQPKKLPANTGKPVVFRGSTTGPSFTEQKCSPMQATWSVRPQCAKVDIASLNQWCSKNAFKEDHGHGVRQLVTAPPLLDRIK
ncbi:MAG: cadmium carbonic anhydrase [Proteobacteria bacterium]|nr:cadmium carbonic anhydrase [Pseudomonadota bacterium]